MADSESIKIFNQAAVQAATMIMMIFRDTEIVSSLATTPNQCANQRHRDRRLVIQ